MNWMSIFSGVVILVLAAAILSMAKLGTLMTETRLTTQALTKAFENDRQTRKSTDESLRLISERLYSHQQNHIQQKDIDRLEENMTTVMKTQTENAVKLDVMISQLREKDR